MISEELRNDVSYGAREGWQAVSSHAVDDCFDSL